VQAFEHFYRAKFEDKCSKLSGFLTGVGKSVKEEILKVTGFELGEFQVRYFGLPCIGKPS